MKSSSIHQMHKLGTNQTQVSDYIRTGLCPTFQKHTRLSHNGLKLAESGNLWSYFSASKDKKLAEGLIKVLLNTKQEVNRSLIQCWLDYEKSLTQLDLPCDYLVILRCPR